MRGGYARIAGAEASARDCATHGVPDQATVRGACRGNQTRIVDIIGRSGRLRRTLFNAALRRAAAEEARQRMRSRSSRSGTFLSMTGTRWILTVSWNRSRRRKKRSPRRWRCMAVTRGTDPPAGESGTRPLAGLIGRAFLFGFWIASWRVRTFVPVSVCSHVDSEPARLVR